MTGREIVVTPLDLDLLTALDRERTLVAACRRLGISRDRGVYRLARLAEGLGHAVVASDRGGSARGTTHLTGFGRSLLNRTHRAVELSAHDARAGGHAGTILTGRFRGRPHPRVEVSPSLSLFVGFEAAENESVTLRLDPEAVLLATERFETSARNVLAGTVERVRSRGPGSGAARREVTLRVGPHRIVAAVTPQSVERLGLAAQRPVVLYLKATAIERVAPTSPARRGTGRPTPGSRPR